MFISLIPFFMFVVSNERLVQMIYSSSKRQRLGSPTNSSSSLNNTANVGPECPEPRRLPIEDEMRGESCYELAMHAIKVRRSGALLDVNALWEFEGLFVAYFALDSPVCHPLSFGRSSLRTFGMFLYLMPGFGLFGFL